MNKKLKAVRKKHKKAVERMKAKRKAEREKKTSS
jgi:hypothetical protein